MPCMRTYCAETGVNVRVSTPPVLAGFASAVCQVLWSVDTSIAYDVACAFSQLSTTLFTSLTEPRSTSIHWSSVKPDDQRVPASPSLTLPGLNATGFSESDATTGRFRARLLVPDTGCCGAAGCCTVSVAGWLVAVRPAVSVTTTS